MKDNRVLIGIGVAALLALLTLFYFSLPERQPKTRFEWDESSWRQASGKSYQYRNDQPYGTKGLYRLLNQYHPDQDVNVLHNSLVDGIPLDTSGEKRTYVFIGEGMFLDSADTEHLVRFVKKGNTALILSKTIPFDLMFHIYYNECENAPWDDYKTYASIDTVQFSLAQPAGTSPGKFFYARRNVKEQYSWAFIPPQFFCSNLPYFSLGKINDSLTNFASFACGEGKFLLHTNPLAFTNYHLLRPDGKAYAESVLSYLPQGVIYWDEFSRIPEPVARRRNRNRPNNNSSSSSSSNNNNDSPESHAFTYILQQESLKWAWYLLLGLGFTYLLFRARRRQRLIPVVTPNENSSYEFISTIANLHFREQNFKSISIQAMRLFLIQVKEKYGLVATLDHRNDLIRNDEQMIPRLAQFSQVPVSEINQIFNQYKEIVRFTPEQQQMIQLHLAIEQFWKKAK